MDRPILHFTHVNNLPGVVASGGLEADSILSENDTSIVDCADAGIKARRRAMAVKVAPFGYVSDYVPFYFAPRSPMMYRISKGGVRSYPGSAAELVYLVSSVQIVDEAGLRWVFSDGNCGARITDHYNQLHDLETAVDWDVMRAQMWADTDEDGDRKRRRAAEFLVHERFPLACIRASVVKTERMAARVRPVLPQDIVVKVDPYYYF
ncbi:MAG: DUF4433 domain-containing protein [Actinomycetota bacterium]|nr:DUF4433 domain-containing protein [Actinomycetota bacterium]